MKYFAILLFWASTAFAQYVDLSKGEVVGVGECQISSKTFPCVAVEHDGKLYLVLMDKKGEAYQVLVDDEGVARVIYIRDSI